MIDHVTHRYMNECNARVGMCYASCGFMTNLYIYCALKSIMRPYFIDVMILRPAIPKTLYTPGLRDLETESESDVRAESSIYGSTSSQASTLRNEEVGTNETELIDLIIEDSANDNPILPWPFHINMLPSELPTREGRNFTKRLVYKLFMVAL